MSARFETLGINRTLRTIAIATILALATFGLSAIGPGAASASDSKGSSRIVGGTSIAIGSAPYQVAIIDATEGDDYLGQFCGGSILSKEIIVTAAHCFVGGFTMTNLRILAGSATLSSETLSTREVSGVTIHPDWNAATNENDIAIIRLQSPLTFQAGTIEAISLPSSVINANTAAYISGWGYTGYKNDFQVEVDLNNNSLIVPFPLSLQGATIYTGSDAACLTFVGAEFKSASMLCAGDFEEAIDPQFLRDTCQGDSGGPLVVTADNVRTLAGITSWGVGCAWNEPGVYTKVSSYVNWIKSFAGITYSATTFDEAAANDGSISTSVTITLSGDTFTGANGAALGTVTNVPAGLTASLIRTSTTTATLSFTGNATTHTNAADISNLTVTFGNGDFTGGVASLVSGATKDNLVIDFADPATSGGGGGGGVSLPVVIITPPSTGLAEPIRARVSGFAGNSAKLNKIVRADIRAALRDNPGAKTATCRAFAPTDATPAETSLARSRAAASCAYIAKRAPGLKITVVKGTLKAKTDSQERRVRVIFG